MPDHHRADRVADRDRFGCGHQGDCRGVGAGGGAWDASGT
jgi:hypothetical protein